MSLADEISAWPMVIQGGMGIGVSNYQLARAAAQHGALGVVSGTALDTVLVRRLQLGDAAGDMRRALAFFPWPEVAERVLAEYFVPGGKAESAPFRLVPLPNLHMSRARLELLVVANFVEVLLAKQGHAGRIGINYLEKIQLPTLASLLGALLAGVDAVLMGAGIPLAIPGAIDALSRWEPTELRLSVEGNVTREPVTFRVDPRALLGELRGAVRRPEFLAIVSSHIIAKTLLRKASGSVDGFVIEHHSAGGHNAPPRKQRGQSENSFGPMDEPDLGEFRALGVPFWIAGSAASAERLAQAREAGAHGVQVGTAFAFCRESGIDSALKRDVVRRARGRQLRVVTDFEASPTGYPFKRVERGGEEDEIQQLRARPRVCDLGYLRRAYTDESGALGYRCPGEPVETFIKKGGTREETINKLCLCNQLLATVGLGQMRAHGAELPLLTAGQELPEIARWLGPGASEYSAADVMAYLTGGAQP